MDTTLLSIVRERQRQTNESLQRQITQNRELTEHAGEADGFRIYSFASLPFASDGMTEIRFAFVSDGLDIGETTGNGTGVLCVYKPALDEWRRVADNTIVTT